MNTRIGRIPLIDSHIHLWDISYFNYPWLKTVPKLKKSFLLGDLEKATQSLSVESFVFVQADCDPKQSLAEVTWVTALSKQDSRIRGIVAHVPLEQGEAARQHLMILKKNPLVKGVRRLLQSEENKFCLQDDFIKGVQMLAEFNFNFDICIKASQLPAVIELVKKCPNVKFILDHLGKPNVAEKELRPWQDDMEKLAALPNVYCKISGLITEANHQSWCVDDLKPYIMHAIKVFGVDRVIFGSDWPVVGLAGTYMQWISALDDLLKSFSEMDLRKLFYENSQSCYRLSTPEPAETEKLGQQIRCRL